MQQRVPYSLGHPPPYPPPHGGRRIWLSGREICGLGELKRTSQAALRAVQKFLHQSLEMINAVLPQR